MNTKRIFFYVWLLTLCLIPVGWWLFEILGNTGWGRVVVGVINSTNGAASMMAAMLWTRLDGKSHEKETTAIRSP